ncbi:hypothetical protein WBG78_09760 [Chryseolinea sp. T2]|uniref:hypothetical protein n=1 Tax=Chryseolinea sp. T2 TaxID=3129255 RepID=UPI003076F11E
MANQWHSGFAYRTELEWYFFGAGMLVMFIAWMTAGVRFSVVVEEKIGRTLT